MNRWPQLSLTRRAGPVEVGHDVDGSFVHFSWRERLTTALSLLPAAAVPSQVANLTARDTVGVGAGWLVADLHWSDRPDTRLGASGTAQAPAHV